MQHTFASKEGPVEVTLTKIEEAFILEGHELRQHNRGRLHLTLRDGRTYLAHAAKVGDVWWVHLNGRTYKWERIEPGSAGNEDEGCFVAPMPGKFLEVLVSEGDTALHYVRGTGKLLSLGEARHGAPVVTRHKLPSK